MKLTLKTIVLGLSLLFITDAMAQKPKSFTNGQAFQSHHRPKPPKTGSSCPNSTIRTIEGTCNNTSRQERIDFGAADIPLFRSITPMYGLPDHYNDMSGQDWSSPRKISNEICQQTGSTSSVYQLSSFVFTWGQFLDHDITLTPEASIEYAPIELPNDESLFTNDIHFFRSEVYENSGLSDYRQQRNLITSWIDASNVYGSDEERAQWLRTFQDGKLKISSGNLLPFNTLDGEFDSPIDPTAPSMAGDNGGTAVTFVAGDVRAAEQPGLTSLHTLFVRAHNTVCDDLKHKGTRGDENIYQLARKEIGAIIQSITYNEFLPALGIQLSTTGRYNDNIQADVSNIFATAAYRLGHTMVTDKLLLKSNSCQDIGEGSIALLEGFFNPQILRDNHISPILKGLSMQIQNEVDPMIIDQLRNFLFGDPSSGNTAGLDLASLNIQRGRDHGLPDYNTIRRHYTGDRARNWKDISSDITITSSLKSVYTDVNEIDAWVGLLCEDKMAGKSIGKTLFSILKQQFEKLRDGDRFFFTNDKSLNRQDKERINKTRLSDVIMANTSLTNLSKNVFIASDCQNSTNNTIVENRSVEQGASFKVNIYPNPSSDHINIELLGNPTSESSMKIYDQYGNLIRSYTAYRPSLSIEFLESGTYLLAIQNKEQVETTKFIKVE